MAPRAGFIVLRTALLFALAAGTIWGVTRAYQHATTAEYFSVQSIEISGNRRIHDEEVLDTAKLTTGVNIFSVHPDTIITALRSHPWVEHVEVRRRLPRSVEIEITERKPAAIVLFDVPYLVDASGQVFKRWSTGDPSPSPIITGMERERFTTDEEAVDQIIRDAIALAKRYRASGLDRRYPLAEIHAEPDEGFSLSLGGDPVYVRLGKVPYRKKLSRLTTLLTRVGADGGRPAIVYLDNELRPDRITVKLKETPEPEHQGRASLSPQSGQKRLSKI